MNIKSLLLGSAAALAVVSGAHAADAIVAAEPEPAEYVKVCDAFGKGYFYIPGSETCLKIGGRVRFDVQAANSYTLDGNIEPGESRNGLHNDGYSTKSRAELYFDSASDTEYGALKTQIAARFDFDGTYNDLSGHTTTKLIAGNIQLGGLLVGLADSQFSSFTGYAGDIINDDVIRYGGFEVNQVTYNFDAGNGFTAVVSLEDDRNKTSYDALGNVVDSSGRGYMPDVVAGIGYSMGGVGFKVVGGYDESAKAGAVKARIDSKFGALSAWAMAGWNSDGSTTNAYAPADYYNGLGWGNWAVWGGLGYQVTEDTSANVQLAYDDNKTFAAAANMKFFPVQGLLVQPEITYTKFNHGTLDGDQWNGMIRLQRTF